MSQLNQKNQKFDFSGFVTKYGIKCDDGATIQQDAFKHMHGKSVPMLWQHQHNDPGMVLGRVTLEHRTEGLYGYGKFNTTPNAMNAKDAVSNGDIIAMSIFANKLTRNGGTVSHGTLREVSLVIGGANPEASIDYVSIRHANGFIEDLEDEAIIHSGCGFDYISGVKMGEEPSQEPNIEHATMKEVFDSMSEEQKNVTYAMVAAALEEGGDNMAQSMTHNIFEGGAMDPMQDAIMHAFNEEGMKSIATEAVKCGSYKEAFLAHAATYGIENIDILFPDAQTVTPTPDFIQREMDWVGAFMAGTQHRPFARIKSTAADITADEARARGYVKGNLKKDEVIKLLKRVTHPQTIYKRQKLDRDDIIDITELDVVAWLKAEMRMMLNYEIALATLLGDGRAADDEDKINEENIRPIWTDADMYVERVVVPAGTSQADLVDLMINSREHYKGKGVPTLYATNKTINDMYLQRDTTGQRIYRNRSELASDLDVAALVPVSDMDNRTHTIGEKTYKLMAIQVRANDYVHGTDKGGSVSMFDDFDIDYNQYKYLIETRLSGALVHPKTAIVFEMEVEAPAAG